MIPPDAKVLIVDDDAGFRDSLGRFFHSMGIDVRTFRSGFSTHACVRVWRGGALERPCCCIN